MKLFALNFPYSDGAFLSSGWTPVNSQHDSGQQWGKGVGRRDFDLTQAQVHLLVNTVNGASPWGPRGPRIWGRSCEADPRIPTIWGLTVEPRVRESNYLRDFEARLCL